MVELLAGTIGLIIMFVVGVILIVLSVLWIIIPFVIIGIRSRIETTNDLLRKLIKQNSNPENIRRIHDHQI